MICLACRRQLVAAASARARNPAVSQSRARASLSSAAPKGPASVHAADLDFIPSIEDSDPNAPRDVEGGSSTPAKPRLRPFDRSETSRRARDSRLTRDSLQIFQNVVNRQTVHARADPVPRDISSATVEYYNNLARLRPMMKTESLDKCLDWFLTQVLPKAPYQMRNRLMKQRGTYLLSRIAEAKAQDFDNETLPSVSRITQLFHQLDSLTTPKWSELMMSLIDSIFSRSANREDFPSDQAHTEALAKISVLIDDLIQSWGYFVGDRLMTITVDSEDSHGTNLRLPGFSQERLQDFAKKKDLIGAFTMVVPDFLPAQYRHTPPVAIATFFLLMDPTKASTQQRTKAKPLLRAVGHILSVITVEPSNLEKIFELWPKVATHVFRLWTRIVSRLQEARKEAREEARDHPKVNMEAGIVSGGLVLPNVIRVRNDLNRALKMGDVTNAEAAWTKFWGEDNFARSRRLEFMRTQKALFDQFIMVFTALRHPQRSLDVWETMERIGVRPTKETWTSIMEGCRRCKNATGIENIWKRMTASGLKLDDLAWSVRIVGLIDCNQAEAGIRALKEMSRLAESGGVEVTVNVVNAAVSGLLRLNAVSMANQVLLWASRQRVKLNVVTYNSRLKVLVREGKVSEVKKLLAMMSEDNVQPDAATYTTLLDGLIGTHSDKSPEEQREMVDDLMAEMEAAGIKANSETFARMLHLIICDPTLSPAAKDAGIDAIYTHIRGKGIRISTEIQTIMVTHYFSCTPPALDKIDRIVRDPKVLEDVDRVFCERLIKGYATVCDGQYLGKAFKLFEQINNCGGALTLSTLEVLLRALVDMGMMEEGRRVVEVVKQHRALLSVGTGASMNRYMLVSRYWRHGFWGFAHDAGLLSMEEWEQLSQIWSSEVK